MLHMGPVTSDLFGVYLVTIEFGMRMRQKAAIIEGGRRSSEQHVVVVHGKHRRRPKRCRCR